MHRSQQQQCVRKQVCGPAASRAERGGSGLAGRVSRFSSQIFSRSSTDGMQIGRKQQTQLLKHVLSTVAIGQSKSARSALRNEGLHFPAEEIPEFGAGLSIHLQAGRNGEPAHRARAGRCGELLLRGLRNITLPARHRLRSPGWSASVHQLQTHSSDLFVNGFQRNPWVISLGMKCCRTAPTIPLTKTTTNSHISALVSPTPK